MKTAVRTTQKLLTFLIFNLIVVAVIFLLIEGLASFILFFQAIAGTPPVAERTHTQYDAELGWVNRPDVYIENMYGPGLDLETNAQGFRNDEDFGETVPTGQLRVICSGDSFTLGYGVDNDHTWCQRLAALDNRLQTVNMGQGGYGVDQAYLWYKRDGTTLAHDIHLFTFITNDFERMRSDSFLGYGKPVLDVQYGRLVVGNVPVPERAFYVPWLTQNSESLKKLKTVQLLSGLFQNSAQAETNNQLTQNDWLLERVNVGILQDLQQLNRDQNSLLVLVYLPTLNDYQPDPQGDTEQWRQKVRLAAQDLGIPFIDLIEEFRMLPASDVPALFLREGEVDFPGAAGHYTVSGNDYIAQRLYEQLTALPEVAGRLADVQ